VTGRHEPRQVAEPVLVHAPEDRPDDLCARGDDDDEGNLGDPLWGKPAAGQEQDDPRRRSEHELLPLVDVAVEPEDDGEIGRHGQAEKAGTAEERHRPPEY
jgi:hypothetical protein